MELGGMPVGLSPDALPSSNVQMSGLLSHHTRGPATWECEFGLYKRPRHTKRV